MACCHQTTRSVLSFWPIGVWNSVDCILVDFWPKMGTTAFFADMLYKLTHPFSEKAACETDLTFFTTSQLHLLALYMLSDICMTYTIISLSHILLFVSTFEEYVGSIVLYFFCECFALTLSMAKCWAVNVYLYLYLFHFP
jgi:hypothetical protein